MKRVGLLTFHFVNNCGAVLQCLALQKVLDSFKDVDVTIINYQPPYHTNMYRPIINPFSQAKALAHSFIDKSFYYRAYRYCRNVLSSVKKSIYFVERCKKREIYQEYYVKHMTLSTLCRDKADLYRECGNYDIYIVGSDQLWNSSITNYDIDYSYYLDFVKNDTCKRVTYAVSAVFKNGEIERILPFLKKFNYISLRERGAYEQLAEVIGSEKLRIDLDPSFLLTKEEYQCFEDEIFVEGDYVIFYGLPSKNNHVLINALRELCSTLDLPIIDISPIKHKFPIKAKRIKCYSPGQFLTLFKNAVFVLTNSYHGVVFSVIYNKEFCAVRPSLHSERITYLLDELNLGNRLFDNQELMLKKIDWTMINEIVENKRMQAFEYLKSVVEVRE